MTTPQTPVAASRQSAANNIPAQMGGHAQASSRNAGVSFTSPDQIIQTAAKTFGVLPHAIVARERGLEPIALARMSAIVAIITKCGLDDSAAAAIFGRCRSTAVLSRQKIAARCETDLAFKNSFHSLLAGHALPYKIAPQQRGKQKRISENTPFRPKSSDLPAKQWRSRRLSRFLLGLDILGRRMALGKQLPKSAPLGTFLTREQIAAFCGCTTQNICGLEKVALKKLRNKLRIALNLTHADLASFPSLMSL